LANDCAWADGHWAIYRIHHVNIHEGLLNLSPDTFSGVKMVKKYVGGWVLLGELTEKMGNGKEEGDKGKGRGEQVGEGMGG